MRVLLVEDDDADALLVEELLRDADPALRLTRTSTIGDAIAMLAAGEPDCVVLDLALPDADGLEALAKLRAVAPRVPTIVLTGRPDAVTGLDAVAAGAQDHLVKGRIDGELLARAIRYAVERRRAEDAEGQLRSARLHAVENARLERGLLARPILADARVQVTTGYRPGRERTLLGGDFFDVVERPDGSLHALIGDVAGHDPDAAALGVCLRVAWRTLVLGGRDLEHVLPTLEEVLIHERVGDDAFATAAMVSVAPDRRSASVRRAGHPAPVLVAGGAARELSDGPVAPPLGTGLAVDGFPAGEVALPPDWSLLLYTDGLIEGRIGAGDERLGSARLVQLVERHVGTAEPADTGPRALIEHLIATALELNGGDLADDLAVLVVGLAGDG
jgi:serine phosphatase RsbU (regulator of sigma subunit)